MFNNYKNKYGIYKLTNKLNGKIYIGKSKNLFSRIQDHKYNRSKCVIDRSIKLHGWNNFEVEILESFDSIDKTELLAIETAYIDFFQSLVIQNGYNVCLFGSDRTGFAHSQETKNKISKSKKGKMCGKQNPFYGKTHSIETMAKILQTKSKNPTRYWLGKTRSIKDKIKMRLAKLGKPSIHSWKKVRQIEEKTGKTVRTWKSQTQAAKSLEITRSHISNVCLGKRKSAGGFLWEYA